MAETKRLVVAQGHDQAKLIASALYPDGWPAGVGNPLTGRRFHAIDVHSVVVTGRSKEWLDHAIRTKLAQGCAGNVTYHDCVTLGEVMT